MAFKWKLLLYSAMPQLIVVCVLVPLAWITGNPTFAYISIGVSVGLTVGSMVGGRVRERILENVYGKHFRKDAVAGRLLREWKRNPPPPV